MTSVIDLLEFEENYSPKPYRDSEGYPTVAIGIRIGPKGADLANYQFTVPHIVATLWTQTFMDDLMHQIDTNPKYAPIKAALIRCAAGVGGYPLTSTTPYYTSPRAAVLLSMGYQMGLDGLLKFTNTLVLLGNAQFNDGADNMMKSLWAKQAPNRAKRHSDQMRNNVWAKEY